MHALVAGHALPSSASTFVNMAVYISIMHGRCRFHVHKLYKRKKIIDDEREKRTMKGATWTSL
jgi:hypothetical protein